MMMVNKKAAKQPEGQNLKKPWTVLKYIVDKYNLLLIFINNIYTNAKVIIRR